MSSCLPVGRHGLAGQEAINKGDQQVDVGGAVTWRRADGDVVVSAFEENRVSPLIRWAAAGFDIPHAPPAPIGSAQGDVQPHPAGGTHRPRHRRTQQIVTGNAGGGQRDFGAGGQRDEDGASGDCFGTADGDFEVVDLCRHSSSPVGQVFACPIVIGLLDGWCGCM